VTPATLDQIDALTETLRMRRGQPSVNAPPRPSLSPLATSLCRASSAGPPETKEQIARLKSALACISADVPRGIGRVFDSGGEPTDDYWLGAVWGIASLGWEGGEALARGWSQTSNRYDEKGFDDAWAGFDPEQRSPVGIGSVFKLAKAKGWDDSRPVPHEQPAQRARYTPLARDDIKALPAIRWRLKKVLPQTGLAAVFGPSGSGKSFLTLDLGINIAAGRDWFGIKTSTCPVTLVMLEGAGGLKARVEAWERQNNAQLPTSFRVIAEPFQLTDSGDVDALAGVLPTGGVLIIDTLNRATPTADENSSADMGKTLQALKRLEASTGGLVLIVHHTGKDASRGMRGHSSLHAALDAAIEVERSATGRTWRVAKAKDGEDGQCEGFTLAHHVLGQDADGDEIASCAVTRGSQAVFVKLPPSGKNQQAALAAIRRALAASPAMAVSPCLPPSRMAVLDAVAAVAAALITTEPPKRSNRARSLVQNLLNSGHLKTGTDSQKGEWLWLS
jgi:hypothetical protein